MTSHWSDSEDDGDGEPPSNRPVITVTGMPPLAPDEATPDSWDAIERRRDAGRISNSSSSGVRALTSRATSHWSDSDDDMYDGSPDIPDRPPGMTRGTMTASEFRKVEEQLAMEQVRRKAAEERADEVDARWSQHQEKWRGERRDLQQQLRNALDTVETVRNAWEERGMQMRQLTYELGKEHEAIHDKARDQVALVEQCYREVDSLKQESEMLREKLQLHESEAQEMRHAAEQQDSQRIQEEQRRAEEALEGERAERRRLESVRLRLEQELQSALENCKDTNRRFNEARRQEVDKRMRMESEVAESRRTVALLRAEFATEQAHRLCGGGSPSRARQGQDGSDDAQALAARERELATCRSELRTFQQEAAAARERERAAVDDLAKAAQESIVNRHEMLAEREKARRLAEAVSLRDAQIVTLQASAGHLSASSSSPVFHNGDKSRDRLAGLARGSAATISALRQQVQSLTPESSPEGAGAGAGPGPSPQQTRAVLALERQADRLSQRSGRWAFENAGSGGDEAAGASPEARLRNRLAQKPLGGSGPDSLQASGARFGSELTQDNTSPVERSASLSQALDKAVGRLERLHSRLTGLSPTRGSGAAFDNVMRSLSPTSR